MSSVSFFRSVSTSSLTIFTPSSCVLTKLDSLRKRPVFTPAHQLDFEMGMIASRGGLDLGSPIICFNRRSLVILASVNCQSLSLMLIIVDALPNKNSTNLPSTDVAFLTDCPDDRPPQLCSRLNGKSHFRNLICVCSRFRYPIFETRPHTMNSCIHI